MASPPVSDSADLDFPALGAALWRKRWKVIVPTLLTALAALVVVQLIPPKYSSEARVLIEERENVYLRPDADKITTDPTVDQEAVTSQAQIIMSRDVAREVIKKLKLNEKPEFDPALNGVSPLKSLLALIGLAKDPLSMTPEERVLNAYYDRLSVFPVEKSRIISIVFLSEDPELAAQVANAIADAYLVRQREAKQEQAQGASQWLASQIETMRQKVEAAEAKVEDFRAKANLLVGTNNTTLSAQQLGDVNAQVAAARALKADAEAKAKLIRDMLKSGQPIEASDILNSELIRRLTEQRVTLRAQLAEQSSTLLDNHPRIKELRAQIADLDSQIRHEAATIARSFENDAKLAGARMDSQIAILDQLKKQAASVNSDDVQLRALERDAKSQRDLLESYLAKYREASSHDTINSTPADARVISRATVSNVPAYPKKIPTILIASFAVLVLSGGMIITKEILAAPAGLAPLRREPVLDTDKAAQEAEPTSRLGARLGALFTAAAKSEPRGAAEISLGTIADVADALQNGHARRIAVFGAMPATNRTQSAIQLARVLAETSRVVLIGLASGEAAIRAISSEPAADGLAELVAGTAAFRDIITKDRLSPLHLISPGHTAIDRVDIVCARDMIIRFDALGRSYDYVLIDAGAAGGTGLECIADIAPHAVLAAENPTSAKAARERLVSAGFDDVTAVLAARSGVGETAAAA
jgi:succinoglycan biosynthesis transport protein ExoP